MPIECTDYIPVPPELSPSRVTEIELSAPLHPIHRGTAINGTPYGQARILLRLRRAPIAVLDVPFENDELTPDELAAHIWLKSEDAINMHLTAQGQPAVTMLTAAGLKVPLQQDEDTEGSALVSIVVCTRERPDQLRVCLDSLLQLEYPALDIIVVDNAPATSSTHDLVHSPPYVKHVRYVREDTPGLSHARNHGVTAARGTYIAMTDDDVKVDPYWVSALVAGFRSAPGVACVTGLTQPLELETEAQALFERYGGFARGFKRFIYDLEDHRPSGPSYPYSAGRFGSGVNMAFDAKALRKLGEFDALLGAGTPSGGGEDLDMFLRVIRGRYRLVYQPEALIWHAHRREYDALKRQMYAYGSGFTAYLAKCVLDEPSSLATFFRSLPAAISNMYSPRSVTNVSKGAQFPSELTRLERQGMLYGARVYTAARLRSRTRVPVRARTAVPE